MWKPLPWTNAAPMATSIACARARYALAERPDGVPRMTPRPKACGSARVSAATPTHARNEAKTKIRRMPHGTRFEYSSEVHALALAALASMSVGGRSPEEVERAARAVLADRSIQTQLPGDDGPAPEPA